MNIYLDIDGVLLANEKSAAKYADEFIQAVVGKYPDSTYWLTTHVWKGENRVNAVLAPYLKPETVALLDKIKPTEWGELKTDAIDFTQPFLWFDDDLYDGERKVLEEHNVLASWIEIDLSKNENQLKEVLKEL